MSRELKRVPMDFDWPMKKTWHGFINPHWVNCPQCEGTGATSASRRLGDLVGLIMLSGEDAAREKGHPYFHHMPGLHGPCGAPSKDMTELTIGLAGREPGFFGHDGCDRWSAVKKIKTAAGVSEDWGTCTICGGEGIDPAHQKAYEAWEDFEPPTGDGYQMWETTSEGSPISPVMESPDDLAHWLADNNASAFGSDTASYDQWLAMIQGPGWAPSAIGRPGVGLESGVVAMATMDGNDEPAAT